MPQITAIMAFISPLKTKYPAGIITTSEGKGKKLDSKNIIIKIPV